MTNPTSSPDPTVPDIPPTSDAVTSRVYGTPEVLRLEPIDTPTPGEGEVLVRVAGSSANPYDWHFLTGTPWFMRLMSGLRRPKHPILGADLAGTVVALGAGVETLRVGEEVVGLVGHGAFAEHVAVRADLLVPKPSEVSFDAAAATPLAGLTALQAVRTHAQVTPGETVLVNGAAGGVGTFAVQIAVTMGAEVTAVTSTANVEMVRGLGAVEVVDYRREDVVSRGQRFDVVIDTVGNHDASSCLALLNDDGRYVAISGPKDNRLFGPMLVLIGRKLRFRFAQPTFIQMMATSDRDDLGDLAEMLADGRIEPVIHQVVGLDGVAAALDQIATGHTPGKIVVRQSR